MTDGWTETHVSADTGRTRVYRKSAGDLVLTVDAAKIDQCAASVSGGLDEVLRAEWGRYIVLRRRHG